jgi:hypothetical protein
MGVPPQAMADVLRWPRAPDQALFRTFAAGSRFVIGRVSSTYRRKRPNMSYQPRNTYAFGFRAVQDEAPRASGIYTIYTSRRWLYVGESDDIRQSLFGHLNRPQACETSESEPLSFSFELAVGAARGAKRRALDVELAPACRADSASPAHR